MVDVSGHAAACSARMRSAVATWGSTHPWRLLSVDRLMVVEYALAVLVFGEMQTEQHPDDHDRK